MGLRWIVAAGCIEVQSQVIGEGGGGGQACVRVRDVFLFVFVDVCMAGETLVIISGLTVWVVVSLC